ncbi:hypothetical protein [Leifsonia sp. Le1]|uniref:hypothetical protein n=1 Tax=Leifsonia sp. Le1 TaxID=3404918 RepID=UPI003EBD49B7
MRSTQTRPFRAAVTTIALAALVTTTSSACTGKDEPRMPAREGRDIVVNFVFDTIEHLDVTSWVP